VLAAVVASSPANAPPSLCGRSSLVSSVRSSLVTLRRVWAGARCQRVDGHEVSIVDDGDDELSFGVERFGFVDEALFAFVIAALGIELEGMTEKAQHVVPGVQ